MDRTLALRVVGSGVKRLTRGPFAITKIAKQDVGMDKLLKLLCLLLMMMLFATSTAMEPNPIPTHPPQRYSKVFASLGVVCKCCDGVEGGCRSYTGDGFCSKLQCLPWKFI
ncbi:hypothetical protein RJ639_032337 [Escallonia herrerae]|uniref:Uncharacterized protein n=1 Tax=Escallonia herrerae TaxID=1293975 RepID=A0AA89BFT5_9ASTE|nr:hypothetical protein RJ639_032337 [Escallonia herrerae]